MLTRQAIRKAFKNHRAVDLASSDADMACTQLEESMRAAGNFIAVPECKPVLRE